MTTLTVDVEAPRVLDLAGRHDGVLGAAPQHLAQVGRLRLVAQRALGYVARVGGLEREKENKDGIDWTGIISFLPLPPLCMMIGLWEEDEEVGEINAGFVR